MLALLLAFATSAPDASLPAPPPPSEHRELLTLPQALRNTDDHLPSLQVAVANTAAARARVTEARGPLLPQFSGQATLMAIDYTNPASGSGLSGLGFATSNSWRTTLNLTATQLLWDFGNTLDKFRAARRLVDQVQHTEEETRVVAHQTTRVAYYSTHALAALARVARETLANEKKHLDQTDALVRVGTQPPIAIAQERTTYANDVFQVFQAEGNLASGRALLNQAMGVEGSSDYDVEPLDAPPIDGEGLALEELLPEALKSRPAFLAADAQVEAQALILSSYKGALGPSLGLQAQLNAFSTLPGTFEGDVIGQAVLSWNLFNGLANYGNIHEQEAGLVADRAQRDQLRQQIRVDLEQARVSVAAAKSGLASAEAAVTNAGELLRLAEGRYANGVGNVIELGDAQVAFTNAEVQRIQAQFTLNSARVTLLAKLGKG